MNHGAHENNLPRLAPAFDMPIAVAIFTFPTRPIDGRMNSRTRKAN